MIDKIRTLNSQRFNFGNKRYLRTSGVDQVGQEQHSLIAEAPAHATAVLGDGSHGHGGALGPCAAARRSREASPVR